MCPFLRASHGVRYEAGSELNVCFEFSVPQVFFICIAFGLLSFPSSQDSLKRWYVRYKTNGGVAGDQIGDSGFE